jgi:hypothetical protein
MATNMIDSRKAQSSGFPIERQEDSDGGTKEDNDRGSHSKDLNKRGTRTVNHRTTNIRTGTVGQGDDDDSDFDL